MFGAHCCQLLPSAANAMAAELALVRLPYVVTVQETTAPRPACERSPMLTYELKAITDYLDPEFELVRSPEGFTVRHRMDQIPLASVHFGPGRPWLEVLRPDDPFFKDHPPPANIPRKPNSQ